MKITRISSAESGRLLMAACTDLKFPLPAGSTITISTALGWPDESFAMQDKNKQFNMVKKTFSVYLFAGICLIAHLTRSFPAL